MTMIPTRTEPQDPMAAPGMLLGWRTFLGVELLIRTGSLIPREETELLGREALAILRELERDRSRSGPLVIDMGCGAGNLGCGLALAVPRARIWASDLAPAAAALTRENVARLSLQARVRVTQGDLFTPLRHQGLEGNIALVVMNPPYIPSASLEQTHAALLRQEPREAFDGGPYGISIITRLLREAAAFLEPGQGHLLFEFGQGQERIIRMLAERQRLYSGIRFARDTGGVARVAIMRASDQP